MWITDVPEPLLPNQQRLAEGLVAVVERHELPDLDAAASTAEVRRGAYLLTFVHRSWPELTVRVDMGDDNEVVVSYADEHEHFQSDDLARGRVWPWAADDHVTAALAMLEGLLTGRVELHVWKRPLAIRTRSYWIDADGAPQVFLRGSTLGPWFGWSRTPTIYRFDFTGAHHAQP